MPRSTLRTTHENRLKLGLSCMAPMPGAWDGICGHFAWLDLPGLIAAGKGEIGTDELPQLARCTACQAKGQARRLVAPALVPYQAGYEPLPIHPSQSPWLYRQGAKRPDAE